MGDWILLSYRVPRQPSAPRIAIWRKLKRLGVAQISDGLVALPLDARTREQLEWVADEVLEARGAAATWTARPTSAAHERELAAAMAAARTAEYAGLIREAESAKQLGGPARRALARRLRAELHRVGRRDFFPPPERGRAQAAISALIAEDAMVSAGSRP